MGSVTTLTDQVREIWEEVLGISPIEDDDDIFDLGGHSLTITQIIARMRKRLDIEVSLDDFFDNPTIAGIAGIASSLGDD
ncbi:phosphopantetheine-binding protein [Streptosporangium sp. NPDC002544]|uniref:phosphopantetheine-binding protein n=1 Tax=unclassified Streptosporangium TaxID=2632669 RepID=UPI00331989B3